MTHISASLSETEIYLFFDVLPEVMLDFIQQLIPFYKSYIIIIVYNM